MSARLDHGAMTLTPSESDESPIDLYPWAFHV